MQEEVHTRYNTRKIKDFVQLMVGSSCLAILGFYLIPDMESIRKFIFYGFLSEMALFTALAVVYDVIPSMNLQEAERFSTIGRHKDLVALLVLLCVFCQAGMLGFQNYILDLQTLTFNRIMIFCLTSLPLSTVRPAKAASASGARRPGGLQWKSSRMPSRTTSRPPTTCGRPRTSSRPAYAGSTRRTDSATRRSAIPRTD